jgi:MFS transporter, ACS family, tartrate transporter
LQPVEEAISVAMDDESVGRSAMRKATWRLIPLIALGYGVAYVDRVNISFASLQMNRDLHFSATVYGLGAGLFFLSYAAFEIPSNLLLYRMGARRWLARIMVTWGVLAMGMMLVRTPFEFYAMRLLLGAAEAGFFPGVLFYLMQWFPAHMRARTISRFYVSLPLSTVFMGAVAGALLNLQGKLGLAGWQWLFLVEGLPAIALSAVFYLCLPDGPKDARWLTRGEHAWIEKRLAEEGAAGDDSAGHANGVGAALREPRVWLFGLINLLMLGTNYAYSFSAPAILQKYTSLNVTNVGYLVSIMGLMGAAGMIGNAWLSDRNRERYFHILAPCLVESACFLMVGFTSNPWMVVPGLAVMMIAHNSMQGPLLVLPTTFLKGKGAAAGLAAINMVGILGGFLGPYGMGVARDLTGSYQTGLAALCLPMLAAGGTVALARWLAGRRISAAAV